MNYYKHHIGDYAQATAHLTFVEDAAYSRMIRKYYAEEKPLPLEIRAIQRLVGARTKEEKQAVEDVLQEFFSKEVDGWHNKRCDTEIEKNREADEEREAKNANEKERQRRHREERAKLFEALRALNIVPPYDTKTETLRKLLDDAHVTPPVTRDNTWSSQHVTPHVTRNATANQTPDTRLHTPDLKPNPEESASTPPPTSTPSGRVCARLRRLGIQGVNPSNPKLLALLASGVPEAEFSDLAEEPIAKGKGLAWILAAVEGRRRDAASVGIPEAEAPKPRPVCAICGAFASKQIGRTDYCPNHDQFSERVAA